MDRNACRLEFCENSIGIYNIEQSIQDSSVVFLFNSLFDHKCELLFVDFASKLLKVFAAL